MNASRLKADPSWRAASRSTQLSGDDGWGGHQAGAVQVRARRERAVAARSGRVGASAAGQGGRACDVRADGGGAGLAFRKEAAFSKAVQQSHREARSRLDLERRPSCRISSVSGVGGRCLSGPIPSQALERCRVSGRSSCGTRWRLGRDPIWTRWSMCSRTIASTSWASMLRSSSTACPRSRRSMASRWRWRLSRAAACVASVSG